MKYLALILTLVACTASVPKTAPETAPLNRIVVIDNDTDAEVSVYLQGSGVKLASVPSRGKRNIVVPSAAGNNYFRLYARQFAGGQYTTEPIQLGTNYSTILSLRTPISMSVVLQR